MTENEPDSQHVVDRGPNRMPADSAFFNKILPILLVGLDGFTILLILLALGILIGIIPF